MFWASATVFLLWTRWPILERRSEGGEWKNLHISTIDTDIMMQKQLLFRQFMSDSISCVIYRKSVTCTVKLYCVSIKILLFYLGHKKWAKIDERYENLLSRMQKTECFYYVMTILYYLQWFNNKNDNGSGMLEITITKGRSFFFDRFDWQNYF